MKLFAGVKPQQTACYCVLAALCALSLLIKQVNPKPAQPKPFNERWPIFTPDFDRYPGWCFVMRWRHALAMFFRGPAPSQALL